MRYKICHILSRISDRFQNTYPISLRVWLISLLIMVIVPGLLSVILDPFAFFHRSDYIPDSIWMRSYNSRLKTSSYSYLYKAKLLINEQPTHLLLGTSVVDNGFRIRGSSSIWYSPYRPHTEEMLSIMGSDADKYFNAAISGGGLYEALHYLQHAEYQNNQVKKVILGMEFHIFTMEDGPRNPVVPWLMTRDVPLSVNLSRIYSRSGLYRLYETLYYYHILRHINFLMPKPERFLLPKQITLPWLAGTTTSIAEPPLPVTFSRIPSIQSPAVTVPGPQFELTKFIFNWWFTNGIYSRFIDRQSPTPFYESSFEYLKDIVHFCKKNNIELDVYISPQPDLFWGMIEFYGMLPYAKTWYQRITAITPARDLIEELGYLPKTESPDKYFVTDTLHFNPEGGKVVMSAMMQPDTPKVNSSNYGQFWQKRMRLHEKWKREHPEIWDAIQHIPKDVETLKRIEKSNTNALIPALYKPIYKDYQILDVPGMFMAVPKNYAAPYNLYKLLAGHYAGTLRAPTLHELVAAIDKTNAEK